MQLYCMTLHVNRVGRKRLHSWTTEINPSMSNGGGGKITPGRFYPRIFGTEKYTTVYVYDFS